MKKIHALVLLLIFTLGVKAQENKTRVAVFDCIAKNTSINEETQTAVREIISSTIVNTRKYKVVERALLEKVMEEQGFQHSGIVDESQIAEIGKITGAAKIILPIVTSPPGDMFILSIKILDVETGNVEQQKVDGVPYNFSELFNKVESMTSDLIGESVGTTINLDF